MAGLVHLICSHQQTRKSRGWPPFDLVVSQVLPLHTVLHLPMLTFPWPSQLLGRTFPSALTRHLKRQRATRRRRIHRFQQEAASSMDSPWRLLPEQLCVSYRYTTTKQKRGIIRLIRPVSWPTAMERWQTQLNGFTQNPQSGMVSQLSGHRRRTAPLSREVGARLSRLAARGR